MTNGAHRSLKILHVLRAPVGGLFRHVLDLARGQVARGHRVGLIADASTGGARAEAALAQLAPELALGVTRVAMSRQLGLRDVPRPDMSHGAWPRPRPMSFTAMAPRAAPTRGLRMRSDAIRVYTPHGGSLHYDGARRRASSISPRAPADAAHRPFPVRKRLWPRRLPRQDRRRRRARRASCTTALPQPNSCRSPGCRRTDLVFVGELRTLKGVDVLIEAIALLAREGRTVTTTIVGDGPDRARSKPRRANLGQTIRFVGAKPARAAFALGRLLVVPSRAESLPYIVLEAAAAGLPLIATHVGGIPEIFGPDAADLVPPGDAGALAGAIRQPCRTRHAGRRGARGCRRGSARVFSASHDRCGARRLCAKRWRNAMVKKSLEFFAIPLSIS